MAAADRADYHDALGYLQRLGMAAFTRQAFSLLSQGERQKVLLARACMARPMLMVLDEPCAGLDPASRESFLAALQGLAESPAGPAMVLVTHHVEEIMPAFSHVLVLDQGRSSARDHLAVARPPTRRTPLRRSDPELVWRNGRCWPIGR